MNWWESAAPGMVIGGIKALQEEAEKERTKAYDVRNRYYVGSDTQQDLIRHIAEGADTWGERQRRFTDCGLTRRIASAFISALYGHDVTRELRDASEKEAETLETVLSESRIASKQRMIGQDQVVAGDGFALVAFSDDLNQLLIHSVDPGNIFVQVHADDPMREAVVVERRVSPTDAGKYWYWVWTDDVRKLVDHNGAVIEEDDNPYDLIPYTHWRGLPLSESYWGLSPVSGVVELHRYCNNLRSQGDRILLYQAHSLLAISDDRHKDEKIETSESNVLTLSKDGRAQYLAPGADLAAIEAAYQRSRKEAFEVAGIPMSLVEGGQAPSGYALVVEYRSMAEVVEDLATEAKEAEEDMIWKVCQIGRAHGLTLPEDPWVSVDLNVEVTPADREGDRQRDLLDVQAGLMTKWDYIQRHRPDIPDEQIDEYLAQLDAEKRTATADSFGLLGSFNPREGVA